MGDLHLYLAPHLDDGVLSCGGLIARQIEAGERATVLTIFAGDPPPVPSTVFSAWRTAGLLSAEAYVALRRSEDRAAVERLGACWLHWELPDCIYRLGPEGQPLYAEPTAIFEEIHPSERGVLVGALTVRLQALCDALRPSVLYAPLGVGHHVDHYLVQWAARRLTPRGWTLRYYEDYPYAEVPGFVQAALEIGGPWQPELEPLTPSALQAKIEAVLRYRSQIQGLFQGEENVADRIKAYAHGLSPDGPAERYWRPETR